ncbi:Protein toll [Folsomia candida]|uniref:Protein toll n=1 Tax=Folsomia candida TaxID=158441 RepID=A0A226DQ15_FOLCA|nr:Protein toll [Folsomia candida]
MVVQRHSSCYIFSFFGIFLHCFVCCFGSYFNCDPVNQGHYCLCSQSEPRVWDIQCPARILEVYPVALKLSISHLDPEEANLRIVCDPNKSHFGWRLVQGVDFDNDITFSITSLEISYCPLISTVLKLDPEDIQSFSYQSWRENVTFPPDFLKVMPNLENLDLTNNDLDSLPSFQDLQFLTRLQLFSNRLTTIPNDTFTHNFHLEEIRLGSNRLSKLDMTIFPSSLIFLDLADNRITTITNQSFVNLFGLQVLNLNSNPLEHVESGVFSPLKNLTELSLDYSKLLSPPVLKNLPKLTNLSISYSLFSSTHELVTTLTPLLLQKEDTEVTTGNSETTNFYTSTTPLTTMTSPPDYKEDGDGEVISENETPGGRSDADDGDDYESNNNSKQKTKVISEELIGDLYSLRKLILINDDLKSLTWLGYLPNLTDLVLSRNQLQVIPSGFFRNLPSVVYVDFSKNSINELNEMDARFMTYLDLSNNFLRILDHDYFKHLRQLRVLLLSTNKASGIEYVHPRTFQNLESLTILDLSNNRISFETGPPSMTHAMRTGGLDMMMMAMSSTMMPTTTMSAGSDEVEEKLDEIQPHNQSPLQYLTKVERINLKNNLINKVFMDWTFVPTNLKSLDLSRNQIKSLHPRDLYFVSQDVRFDLRYNEIADVDMDFADLLLDPLENKNVVVLLDGNPIDCDCHAISFKKFSVKSYHLQYSDLRCASPPTLEGRKFSEIEAKDLRCMLSQSCPIGCSCWELPSENLIKMDCNSLNFLSSQNVTSLKNFTDVYEPLEFEIDISNRNMQHITESITQSITSQFRFVNLTQSGLLSLDFLAGLHPSNNVTKFALSKNRFKCDGCKFQKLWWTNFKRIVDIRNVTCILGENDGSNEGQTLFFQDIVRSSMCSENAISDEIRWLVISLAIVIPVIISTMICMTRLHKGRGNTNASSKIRRLESMVGSQSRAYATTRSKVVDLDSSNF